MMSPNKTKKGAVAIRDSSPEPGPSSSKRAKRSKMSSDDEEDAVPKSKKAAPSKYVSKSKRSPGFAAHNKPAELFRKDLISAMKLPDSEPLQEGSYFLISDPWRQEWEKGVQVPVNMKEILKTDVKEIREKSKTGDFKIPHKLLHERVDSVYKKGLHELTGMQQLSEQLVRYDLDDLDVCWLDEVNFTRREMGLVQINEWNMERVMEALENQCHEKMTAVMKTEEGMGIEYDEDIVCDVCCSPDSEDTNEMVFCDGCDVCIHQACYGIQSIPEGSWLCRTCALGIKPRCMLCPKVGGAMKSTRSGTKWAHVSCALWIPEVSIGIPEKMEPITKISNIPPSRWALLCCLCKERVGACIQCSVKTCKTAFHVTCGFSNSLEMKTVLDETDEKDGVKLKAYCPKHTKKRERGHSESDTDSSRKDSSPSPRKEMTQQERENLRVQKLKGLEEEFHGLVDVSEVCQSLQLDREIVDLVYVYWKLKRKCNWDKPLLTPKTEEADILEKQQEDSLVARMKMFVHLRQDLERVRNLCYMIGKREKTKRQFFRSKEYVFTSMVRVLLDKSLHLSNADVDDIVHNYHFDSIYDDYGLSVQHLPPEPCQDEGGHTTEVEMKEEKDGVEWREEEDAGNPVDGDGEAEAAPEDAAEPKHAEEPSVAEEEEAEEEDPNEALPPGERWSGEFVRSGFFMRRRPKKWMKGAMAAKGKKRKLLPVLSSPEISVPAAPVKPEKPPVEDDNVFSSNEESDEDKEKLAAVVKAIVDKSDDDSDLPQPVLPELVVKSPKSKPLTLHHHRHRRRHRGRKPWHMRETFQQNLHLSSSEDEDMKVRPILERRKEGCTAQEEAADGGEVVDVVGFEETLPPSQQHVMVDVEGEEAAGENETLLSAGTTPLESFGKGVGSSPQTGSDSPRKKTADRSIQKLFDLVRKESEQAKSSESSERTKPVTDQGECVTKSNGTKPKSHKLKRSDGAKKSEKEKRDRGSTFSGVCVEGESGVRRDSSGPTVDSKESDHRRKSSKPKLRSGCAETHDTTDGETGTRETKRKPGGPGDRGDRNEGRRKEREAKHKHQETSNTSRRSRRSHKSKYSNNRDSSTQRLTQEPSISDEQNCNTCEPLQKPAHREEFEALGPVQRLSNTDDSGSVQTVSHKERTDSDDSKLVQKFQGCAEEMRKQGDMFQDDTASLSLPSRVREVHRQRTKKDEELTDKVKHKGKETAESFKSLVSTISSRRKSSSSGHANIFERMERSASSSSGHSSERSNIFESLERHCRESSLDLGLSHDNRQLSEPLKKLPSLDWPSKVEFHLSACEEPAREPQPSDHWLAGGASRSSCLVQDTVKSSGKLVSPFSPLRDKPIKASGEKADAFEALQSDVESSDSQTRGSPLDGGAGKVPDTCQPSDSAACLPSGDHLPGLSEDDLCPVSGDTQYLPEEDVLTPHLTNEDMLTLPTEDTAGPLDQEAPCLSRENDAPVSVEDASCSPGQTAPFLSSENVSSLPSDSGPVYREDTPHLPSENVSSLPSDSGPVYREDTPRLPSENVYSLPSDSGPVYREDTPRLPSENVSGLSGEEENVPPLPEEGAPPLPSKRVPCLPEEDVDHDVHVMDFEANGIDSHPEVPRELVNTSERDLQGSGDQVSEGGTAHHVETEGVHGGDRGLCIETEEANGVASDVQTEVGGASSVGVAAASHPDASPGKTQTDPVQAVGSPGLEANQPISTPHTANNTHSGDAPERPQQQGLEILKIKSRDLLVEFSSRRHRKRSHKAKDVNSVAQIDSSHQKSMSQPDELTHRSSVSKPKEKPRRSSIRVEEKLEKTDSPEARVRHRRKSSHEARLKLSKVLAAPDSSSDDDFEPAQPVLTFPKRQRHDRHSKKQEMKHRGRNMSSEELSEGEDSEEEDDAVERQRRERRRSHHWDNGDKSLQKEFVGKPAPRTCADSLQPELGKLLKPSDLIVEDVVVRRVEDRLLRRYRHNHRRSHVGGLLEEKDKEQKVAQVNRDSKKKSKLFSTKESSKWLRSSGDGGVPLARPLPKIRVLNEITPERSSNFQPNLFGAHYIPRGSLSGYKIPKKSSSHSSVPALPSSPQAGSPPSSEPFGSGAKFSSFKSLAAAGSHYLPCHVEGTLHEHTVRKTVAASDGASDLEAMSTMSSDQLEGRPAGLDSCRDYRSGSPASDVSVVAPWLSDSRESTPRRCTRSQLVDELTENSPSPLGSGASNHSRMKLRDGWLKASNFPS